jgi:hypothetical protein
MSYRYFDATKYCCSYYYMSTNLPQQERPYNSDSTASRSLCEVKHCLARLVLRWGTTLESRVLFFCCSFACFVRRSGV